MNNFWNEIYLSNSIKDWIIALGIIVAAFVAIRIFKSIVLQQVRKWSQRTVTTFDDFVVETVEKISSADIVHSQHIHGCLP